MVKSLEISHDIYELEMGGYKPIQKWLKDRKRTQITTSDIQVLSKIVSAIRTTVDIMDKIRLFSSI